LSIKATPRTILADGAGTTEWEKYQLHLVYSFYRSPHLGIPASRACFFTS
jgi:hypothetical protein